MTNVQKQRLATGSVCSRCQGMIDGMVDLLEKLCDYVKIVIGFRYLEDRLHVVVVVK